MEHLRYIQSEDGKMNLLNTKKRTNTNMMKTFVSIQMIQPSPNYAGLKTEKASCCSKMVIISSFSMLSLSEKHDLRLRLIFCFPMLSRLGDKVYINELESKADAIVL